MYVPKLLLSKKYIKDAFRVADCNRAISGGRQFRESRCCVEEGDQSEKGEKRESLKYNIEANLLEK